MNTETPFALAMDEWLKDSTLGTPDEHLPGRYLKETTEKSYTQYASTLKLFFGEMPMGTIRQGNLRQYQRDRLMGADPFLRYRRPQDARERVVKGVRVPAKGKTPCPVKPKKVNQELALLKRVMQTSGTWNLELDAWYKHHRLAEEEEDTQRALEPDEQEVWLKACASRARWQLVHWYSLLAIGCTLSTNELSYLRLGDVSLQHCTITITGKGVKCRGRRRVIAMLTADELWAAEKLIERAREECGCGSPQHYLFPFRGRGRQGTWDPTKPMSQSGLKREWEEVRDATNLTWFRRYDCRHTGGTKLALDGWRPAQIKARMGHITDQMMEHYTHISEGAQRREHERIALQRQQEAFAKIGPRSERGDRFERRVAHQ